MERRKFLIGAGTAAIGTSALVGSGAFSSVEADRSVTVEVADDNDAYLRLTPQSAYAEDVGGSLEIDFGENGEGGQGLNNDANSVFTSVFRIENQGTQEVKVWVDETEINDQLSSGYLTLWASGTPCGHVDQGLGQDNSGDWDNSPEGIGIRIKPGQWVDVAFQFVGISESGSTTITGTLPVKAAAEDSHIFSDAGYSSTTRVADHCT